MSDNQPDIQPDTLQFELHPDADQLSAFAEGLLPDRERLETMAHLADCVSCREVVFLAQQADPAFAQATVSTPETTPSSWRRWFGPLPLASLPLAGFGAALLAGAALIAITLRPSHIAAPTLSQSAKVEAPPIPPPQAAATPKASPADPTIIHPNGVTRPLAAAPPAPKLTAAAPQVMGGLAKPAASSTAVNAANPSPVRLGNPELKALSASAASATSVNMGGGMSGITPSNAGSGVHARMNYETGASASSALARGAAAPAAVRGVAGGTGTGVAASAPPPPPAPAKPALPKLSPPGAASETVEVSAAASSTLDTQSAAVGATIDSTLVESLPIDGNTVVSMAALLPSKLSPAVTASVGKVTVAIDTAGAVFRSTNSGRKWKPVEESWQGKPVSLKPRTPAGTGQIASSDVDLTAARSRKAASAPLPAFILVTSTGVIYFSADGEHWERH